MNARAMWEDIMYDLIKVLFCRQQKHMVLEFYLVVIVNFTNKGKYRKQQSK